MERTVVGIDVGSSKICTLVGEIREQGDLRVVGVGLVPARGLRKGVVVNVEDATAALAASIDEAERSSGYKLERAYVSVSGEHVSSLNCQGVVGVSHRRDGITVDDVERALDAACAITVPHNHEIIHVIPRGYVVDGQSGVQDPVGMHGFRLEAEVHVVTASSTAIQNLLKCVSRAGMEVDEVVSAAIAAGDAVLTETEREMGVVLADVGAGTTDVAIFINGTVWHTITLGVGGAYVTQDVAIGLRLSPAVAEEIKIKHGHTIASEVDSEEEFMVASFGDEARQPVPRWQLASIIEARAEEILSMIGKEIKRSGYDGLLPAGIVLTGGTAQLPGILSLAREVLDLPARVGKPQGLHGLVDTVNNPAHAVGAGLMMWGSTEEARPQLRSRPGPVNKGRFLDWLRAFLPG
ncbi:MAG: cell division protein FtsA [Anaerolineae bacterium]